jgi:hypothetical protein
MLIETLEHAEVCSVIFIRDYIQFYFEGEENTGTLTTYSLPVAIVGGTYFAMGTSGYRDALCSFINLQVKRFEIIKGQKITITFENEDRLEVSLKKEDSNGFEAAMLRIENQIAVW